MAVGTGVGVAVGNSVDIAVGTGVIVGAGAGVAVGVAEGVGVGVGSGDDVAVAAGVAAGVAVEVGEGMAVSVGATAGVAVLVTRAATTTVDTPGGGVVTAIGVDALPETGVPSKLAGGSAVGAADVGEGVGIPGEGVDVGSACTVTQAVASIAIAPTRMIDLIRFVSLCHISRGYPSAFAALIR